MDQGNGTFKQYPSMADLIEDNPNLYQVKDDFAALKGVFRVGERLEIKGSRFEVSKIINKGLKLKLLPKE